MVTESDGWTPRKAFRDAGHAILLVGSLDEALHILETAGPVDITIVDIPVAGHTARVEFLAGIRSRNADTIIVLCARETASFYDFRDFCDIIVPRPFSSREWARLVSDATGAALGRRHRHEHD